ncbi:Acyl transferase domain [Trypanosoma vivax]|uniref:[acyl-carrier-protein] S-malonyltransferase n=1 Tax=Trypanosoma vivax (strain Y486) TaxID=1055687 RepID=G0U384_TRYVY|nr:putative acyl transferase-like protein [Trypanosoma vivax]KAH8604158.1 Acyl transferase domain [Trypanosoma vivax]CCC50740.1 putative acyl transferase-like protein [Trypanosoma vivax Y486]
MSKHLARALVFSGQGAHRQGMSMEYLSVPSAAHVWERMKCVMEQNYGVSLQEIITENPQRMYVRSDSLDVESVCRHSCHAERNVAESVPKKALLTHPKGVLSLTSLTQPCMLAAQMVALEYLKEVAGYSVDAASVVAGHSLGEFSALCAAGLFPPEVGVDLVYKRGLLIEHAISQFPVGHDHAMFACNPVRARLGNGDTGLAVEQFHLFVELAARALSSTTSFVEVVNYNIDREQYVVAGDPVGLSVLGKCLDPQFRASSCGASSTLDHIVRTALSSVLQDKQDGITMNPNKEPLPDFVTSSARRYGVRSIFRRFLRGPDDGYTPSLEELTHLTLQEDGRSGLKKKSWFIPLAVNVPFHSSRLRLAMDLFLPVVRDALPGENVMRSFFGTPVGDNGARAASSGGGEGSAKTVWLTNLTGTPFAPFDTQFQQDALEMMQSMNVGEIRHNGRYHTNLVEESFKKAVDEGSVRDMCAAVLAAQLAHPVQWIDLMETSVLSCGVREVHEVSPVRTVADMFKRSVFYEGKGSESTTGAILEVVTRCLPQEMSFLNQAH